MRRGLKTIGAMAAAFVLVGVSLAGSPADAAAGEEAASAEGSYIVTVGDGVDPLAVAGTVGAAVSNRYDSALRGFAAPLTATQVAALQRDTRVTDVVVDKVYSVVPPRRDVLPPGHEAQLTSWGQDRMGLLESPTAKVDGKDRRRDRVDADIAVIDTGVASHLDLNVAGGYNCTEGPRSDYADRFGHGTMVAGIAGAIDNAYGRVGTAPGARIWAIKVVRLDGYVYDSDLLCGFDWVLRNSHRIDVANISLGGPGRDTGRCGAARPGVKRDAIHQAVCALVRAGVTVVAAAGNESMDASGLIPAAYPEVIAVSAFTETDGLVGGAGPEAWCQPGEFDDHLATFSNFGSVVDIAAPGVCIGSTFPTTFIDGYYYYYATGSGTSFSAPHVAGAAALVRARHPNASPAQVRRIILAAAAHDPLPGDPDGITEPILDLRRL